MIKVFELIAYDVEESGEKDEKFMKDYFQKQYLEKYNFKGGIIIKYTTIELIMHVNHTTTL